MNIEALNKQYQEKGYVFVPNYYSESEVQQISDYVDQMEQNDYEHAYKYYDENVKDGSQTLTRIEHCLGNIPELDKILLNDGVQQLLNTFLQDKPSLFKDKINFKLPGGKPDLLHQDQAAGWGDYAENFLSMAIFVDDNTKENAAMSVLNTGDYPKSLIEGEWELMKNPEPPFLPEENYDLLEAKAGALVFFDAYVPHGSPANLSDKRRRNIFLTFNKDSEGDHRAKYYADKLASYPPNNMRDSSKTYTYRV